MAYAEQRARSLLKAAESHRAQARDLERRAQDELDWDARMSRRERLDRLAEIVVESVASGATESQAVQRYARHHGISAMQAQYRYDQALKRRRWVRLWRRNREIFRLASKGLRNGEIAAKVAWLNDGKVLHEVTVSKIVNKRLKKLGPRIEAAPFADFQAGHSDQK